MSEEIAEIEARLAQLPDDEEHAPERVDLLNKLGWKMRKRADWNGILSLAGQAMDLAQRRAYQEGLTGAFRNSAFAHYMLADYKAALAEARVARRMAEEQHDVWQQANALSIAALVQWSLGQYDQALEEGFRGIRLVEEAGDEWGMAWGYTTIGGIYQALGDLDNSLRFHRKSHEIFARLEYPLGEARSLSGLGTVYQAQGDLAAALDCHQRALALYRGIGNRIGESRALNDIGELHQKRAEFDQALKLHLEGLALREAIRNPQAQTTSLLNLGRVYLDTEHREEAREMLQRALDIARQIGAKPKESQAHELLSCLHEHDGDFKEALRHHQEFHRLREEVFNEEESTKIRNLQTGIEVERAEKEAEIHRLRNVELKAKNEELARLLNQLRATQSQLIHSEKMSALGDLVAAIAHEINTPLGAIRTAADISVAAAERMLEAIELSKTVEELRSRRSVQATVSALHKNGHLITTASDRIAHMVQSLKSFARLDQAEFQKFSLNESVRDSLAVLEPCLPAGIHMIKELAELPALYGYPAEMNQVVLNLLRNAGEAITGSGTITVRTFQENGHQCLRVADTGRGISPAQRTQLFNPGFRVENAKVRATMSLFTSLSIVQRHRGRIDVESEVGKGSAFTVRLKGLEAASEPSPLARP